MFTIRSDIQTGQDFVDYLHSLFEAKKNPSIVVDLALDGWDSWERQGISTPNNVGDIASDPFETYRAYYLDILSICDTQHLSPDSVFFSLLPTKSFNAYANTTPSSDKVIICDENLIAFFTGFIIAVMVAVYTKVPDDEIEFYDHFAIDQLDDFFNRSKHRTQAMNQTFIDAFMRIIKRDYEMTQVGSYFSLAFTVFILCHELSHHILGHSEQKRMHSVTDESGKDQKIPLNNPSYEEEFEADEHGYQLYLELISKNEQAKSAKLTEAFNRAPLIFFEMLDIAKIYIEKKLAYIPVSDTHPSPMERKGRLLKKYEADLHPYGLEFYEGFMGYSEHIRKKILSS